MSATLFLGVILDGVIVLKATRLMRLTTDDP
jgi:hypothetical protein